MSKSSPTVLTIDVEGELAEFDFSAFKKRLVERLENVTEDAIKFEWETGGAATRRARAGDRKAARGRQ